MLKKNINEKVTLAKSVVVLHRRDNKFNGDRSLLLSTGERAGVGGVVGVTGVLVRLSDC